MLSQKNWSDLQRSEEREGLVNTISEPDLSILSVGPKYWEDYHQLESVVHQIKNNYPLTSLD